MANDSARKRHLLWWAVAGAALVLILWKVPQWQVAHVQGLKPTEQFDRENEARKTLAQILGGIVLLAGAFATWRNLMLAQQGQITDRFTKAIEQLGSVYPDGKSKLDVRLGGIYALARIANDSERDHWPIMEVLCTYVREHAPVEQEESPNERPAVSADLQAILTVLGKRNRSFETADQVPNLAGTNLRRADFRRANLSGADLSWANLCGADLIEADLHLAHLCGADLCGADLNSAHNLTQGQINVAKGDSNTTLSADLHMPESWEKLE